MTVCPHLPPACSRCAPYPGSVNRDPKGLLIAACLLNLRYFDRSVAEDASNKQAGAVTPSQLLPTPGLMLPGVLAFRPALPPRRDTAMLQHARSPVSSRGGTRVSYRGKTSSSLRLLHLQSQRSQAKREGGVAQPGGRAISGRRKQG